MHRISKMGGTRTLFLVQHLKRGSIGGRRMQINVPDVHIARAELICRFSLLWGPGKHQKPPQALCCKEARPSPNAWPESPSPSDHPTQGDRTSSYATPTAPCC